MFAGVDPLFVVQLDPPESCPMSPIELVSHLICFQFINYQGANNYQCIQM